MVLPPGEFTVMIPEPHATLQGAGTWRIQWHVIPEPCVTLQGRSTATWWIHCHDPRATCRIAGCSHLVKSMSWSCHIAWCKNSIRHIENRFSPYSLFFCFLNAFWALVGSSFRIVCDTLLSRSSRQRERLNASMLSICLFVSLFVCLSVANMQKNAIFSKTKQFNAMVFMAPCNICLKARRM